MPVRARTDKLSEPQKSNDHRSQVQSTKNLMTTTLVYRELEPRIVFDGSIDATAAEISNVGNTDGAEFEGDSQSDGSQETHDDTNELVKSLLAGSQEITSSSEIVFIDGSVDDVEQLVGSIDPNFEIVLLQSDQDGVEQIADVLSTRTDINAIHIISHGNQAELILGTSVLGIESMNGSYNDELSAIATALSDDADILIYGCNFGEGELGREAASLLAELTGADVAASVDETGNTDLGGDWELEFTTGAVESQLAIGKGAQESWLNVLVAPTANNDTAVTNVNTPVNIDLVSNDTDPDSGTIHVLDVTDPSNGSVVNNDDGTVTYTPGLNYTGNDSFTYLTSDLDNLVSYWRLDGDGVDSVGSNDGTLTGTTTVAGDYGSALSFDEFDDKVVIPDFAFNNEFSLAFKFKVDDNSGPLFQYFYSHGDVDTTNSLNVFLVEDSHPSDANKLRTIIRDTNDTLDEFALDFDITTLIGDGQWHTYTLTIDAGTGAKVYLDGAERNSDATRGGDTFDPITSVHFGTRENLAIDRFYGGLLDSVQVYDKTLSASEVGDIHTGGTSLATVSVDVNAPPVITSDGGGATALLNAAENQTAVTTVTATDSDIPAETLTYSIIGGDDAALFSINANGELTFDNAPDFEIPSDFDANGVYEVTVLVDDGNGGTDSQVISVTVTNLGGEPSQSLPGAQNVNEDATLVFSSGNGNAITVSDTGPADGLLQVTLISTNGTMTLSQTTGLSFPGGSNGSSSMVLWGTESDLNAALNGMIYTPNAGYNGAASISVTTAQASQMEGYYSFDAGNAVDDSVGVSQDGTLVAGATTVTDGTRGEVLSLNGSTDYVQISGEFGQPANITLSAWVNADSGYKEIFSFQNRLILRVDDPNSSRGVAAIYHDGTSYKALGSGEFIAGTGWRHVALSFDDASKTMSLYLDGQLSAQASYTDSISYSGGDVFIGSNTGASLNFDGKIDDARVYTRTLSLDEIAALATDQTNTSASISITVDPLNDLPVGVPTINGTITEDQTLTIDTSGISDADGLGAFSYKWFRDGVELVGVTTSSYILGDNDVGAQMNVEVSYTDGGGTVETIASAQTAPVANVNDSPAGVPTISGTVTENQTLTANTGGISDADGLGAFAYQWLRNGVAIGGATASTYTLGDADVGALISVEVGYTDGNGTSEGPLTSAQTVAVANVNDAPVGVPTISGIVTEDQLLTANTGGISDADGLGAFSYQWLRDGVAIGGATASTYTLGDADVGTLISVEVSYMDGNGTPETVTSAQTAAVVNVNDSPVGLPTITGTVTENQILTADTSSISDADGLGAFSYQWLRDGVAIGGATASTYTLGDTDVGTQISVEVSYTDGGGTAETVTSVQTAAVTNINDSPVGVPIITGTVTEDQTLAADTSGISDADGLGGFSYQWLRDGVAIGGATASTYTLGDTDVGTQISVEVSYTDGGGTSEGPLTSAQTAAVVNVNDNPVGLPAITGTITENQILTADTSGISDADGLGAFTYQWLRDGVAIGGATASTFTLGSIDIGTQISVEVSYTDGNSTSEGPLTSAQTAAVANFNDPPVGVPTISGTVTEDQILTINTGGISDIDGLGPFSYQWLRDGVAIGGATASTYTLGDADVGTQISVEASYTDGFGTAETVTSAQTAAVVNINDIPVGVPAITGTAAEDQILTADTSAISDADGLGAFSYQWLRDGVAIGGATASTYTLGDTDVGTQISVEVSYTDTNGTTEGPLVSVQTAAVTNINDTPVGVPTITGTVTEDQILTADTSGISDVDGLGTFSYQWLRDGVAIGGATASTYTLGDADVGALISVEASYTDGYGTAETVTSAQTAAVVNINDIPVGVPTITGTVTEDQILTADTSAISDADGLGAFSYQWLRDGVAIGGATASTYTLGDADVATQISVEITYTDGNGTAEGPLTSSQTTPVVNVNDIPVGVPTITGTVTEDQILTADTSGISDADGLGAFTYQWFRDGVAIGGATASTHILGDADVGTQISVEVTYTDGNGTSEGPLISTQTTPVVNINDDPVITSDGGLATATVNINENNLDVTTVTSSDVDGGTPTFSIAGGPEAGLFTINPTSGELSFNVAPDFEFPADGGGINQYDLIVQVSDGNGGTDTQAVTVIVLDVDENLPVTPVPPTLPPTEPPEPVVSETNTEVLQDNDLIFASAYVETLSGSIRQTAAAVKQPVTDNQPPPESKIEIIPEIVPNNIEPVKIKSIDLAKFENKVELKKIDHKLLIAFDKTQTEMQDSNRVFGLDTKVITFGTGTLLTAGYVSWILRSGALLSALLSTIPAWSAFDPIFVMTSRKSDKDDADLTKKKLSKVEHIFENAAKSDKQPVTQP